MVCEQAKMSWIQLLELNRAGSFSFDYTVLSTLLICRSVGWKSKVKTFTIELLDIHFRSKIISDRNTVWLEWANLRSPILHLIVMTFCF